MLCLTFVVGCFAVHGASGDSNQTIVDPRAGFLRPNETFVFDVTCRNLGSYANCAQIK